MKKRMTLRRIGLWVAICLFFVIRTSAQTPTPESANASSNTSEELVLYSDTVSFDDVAATDSFSLDMANTCLLLDDNEEIWSFFSDVLGMGILTLLALIVLLFFGLPLLIIGLIGYFIYRSSRRRAQQPREDFMRSCILLFAIAVALLVTELWLGCGGWIGCIAVFLLCWAGARWFIARREDHQRQN